MFGRIFILEDDARRRAAMQSALLEAGLGEPSFAVTADEFVSLVDQATTPISLISLDHDLEPPEMLTRNGEKSAAAIDPGTGRDAAEFLARRDAVCPIVIHSTNHVAAVAMEAILTECGWRVERVMPYGDLTWIAEMWLPLIVELLRASRRN